MTVQSIPADIHDRCMNDIATLIAAMNLQGVDGVCGDIGQNVFVQLLPEQLAQQFPSVLIDTAGETEQDEGDSFETVGVYYPVKVTICDQMSTNYQQRRPVYLYWRRLIWHMLNGLIANPILPNTPECYNLDPQYMAVIDPGAKGKQFALIPVLVRCWTDEALEGS